MEWVATPQRIFMDNRHAPLFNQGPLRSKTRIAIVLGLGSLCCLLGIRQLAQLLPHQTPGTLWMLMRYRLSSDRSAVLAAYSAELRAREVAPAPALMEHLALRLQNLLSPPNEEAEQLVDFFLSQPVPSAHQALVDISRETRIAEALTGLTLLRISLQSAAHKEQALALIEQLRRGQRLYKPRLGPQPFSEQAVADALAHYQSWWRLQLPWPERRLRDPLAGTPLAWVEP